MIEIHKAAADPAQVGWKDVDPLLREKHAICKLVDCCVVSTAGGTAQARKTSEVRRR